MNLPKNRLNERAPLLLPAAVALGTAAVVAGALLLPSALAWAFLHPPRRWNGKTPRSVHGIAFERVRLRSADGTRLAAWYVPAPHGIPVRGAAIVCHGYFGHRARMLAHTAFLHRAGYAVLTFDFRAHGWSGGARTTFGIAEAGDLTAAVDYVKAHEAMKHLPLAVVSESMGAAVTLLVAADDPRIEAVVADSSFARFDGAIETRFASLVGANIAGRIAPPAQTAGERLLGRASRDIAPVEAIARIAPRPVFLLQGTADEVVPPQSLGELAAAANPETTQVWAIEGARHVYAVRTHKTEYERRVLAFLDGALREPDGVDG